MNLGIKLAPNIMHACCVLHNFIQQHDGEDHDTLPLGQRDAMLEPSDPRAAGRARIDRRAGLNAPWRLGAGGGDAAATGVSNPAGNLAAGKIMRESLKEYCWQLHLRRRDERIESFAAAHAALLDSDDPSLADDAWA